MTEGELLAACLAAPDDDVPRLIYADFLAERGDPRGEFIHVQCALLGETDPQTRLELSKREHRLMKKHGSAWLADLQPHLRSWWWRRGFLHGAKIHADHLLANGAAIARMTVLEDVQLDALTAELANQLEGFAPLTMVRKLLAARQHIGPRQVAFLVAPPLQGLRTLNLRVNPLGDDGIRALGAGRFPVLEGLDLSHTGLGTSGLEALATAPFFHQLTWLSLEHVPAGPEGARLLATGRALRVLQLRGCAIGDEGVIALAESPALAALEFLDLRENDVGAIGLHALVASPHLRALKTIGGIDDPALKAIVHARFGPTSA